MKVSIFFLVILVLVVSVANSQDPVPNDRLQNPVVKVVDNQRIYEDRNPDIKKLLAMIDQADRIIVSDTTREKTTVLFESTKLTDIKEFREALVLIVPDEWFYSICGGPDIVLYRGDEKLVRIMNVAGRSITTSLWQGDVLIDDKEKWFKWFDARKIAKVRGDFVADEARWKKIGEDEARWNAAMPKGLLPEYKKALEHDGIPGMYDLNPMKLVLEREYPNAKKRILALLGWYGSGSGPWSGFYEYEGIAEKLLLEYSTQDLVVAVQSAQLTEEQIEGTARLFADWDFSRLRPNDLAKVPGELKRQLLNQAMKSGDEDKRARAKSAFEVK